MAESRMLAPAWNPAEAWWANLPGADDRAAAVILQTEAANGRSQASVYELFAEMEQKDGHLFSVLQTRIQGLLGLGRRVVAGGRTERDQRAAELVGELWAAVPRPGALLRALLDAVPKGFAAVELVWDYDAQGRMTVADWVAHPQEYFGFGSDGELLLLCPPFRSESADANTAVLPPGRAVATAAALRPAPERKFLLCRFGADARNRYGRGLCLHAYWYYWFKKNTVRFWAVYNERFGSPLAVAKTAAGTPDDERERLLETLRALQADTGVVVPETVTLSLLESARPGAAPFREFADWCNDEMSKIVLGATLTSGEGRRSGSMALGTVHETVRRDLLQADARLLEETVGTLFRWMADLNMPGAAAPRLAIDTSTPANLREQAEVDRILVTLGVPLSLPELHERYGRRVPAEGEGFLRYDDSNLFSYHLRYGILTVNEARARLGLPPVEWGNRAVSASATLAMAQDAGGERDGTGAERDESNRRLEQEIAQENAAESGAEREREGD
jgi:phage gp29-like protein